jgi:hypothetical protein
MDSVWCTNDEIGCMYECMYGVVYQDHITNTYERMSRISSEKT